MKLVIFYSPAYNCLHHCKLLLKKTSQIHIVIYTQLSLTTTNPYISIYKTSTIERPYFCFKLLKSHYKSDIYTGYLFTDIFVSFIDNFDIDLPSQNFFYKQILYETSSNKYKIYKNIVDKIHNVSYKEYKFNKEIQFLIISPSRDLLTYANKFHCNFVLVNKHTPWQFIDHFTNKYKYIIITKYKL